MKPHQIPLVMIVINVLVYPSKHVGIGSDVAIERLTYTLGVGHNRVFIRYSKGPHDFAHVARCRFAVGPVTTSSQARTRICYQPRASYAIGLIAWVRYSAKLIFLLNIVIGPLFNQYRFIGVGPTIHNPLWYRLWHINDIIINNNIIYGT